MQEVRKKLKWADGKAIKSEVELQLLVLLGPKSDADLAPVPKVKQAKAKPDSKKSEKSDGENIAFLIQRWID